MQEDACAAISTLAALKEANQLKLAEAGGIEALVAAMTAHKTSAGVQEQACIALRNLTHNNAGNQVLRLYQPKPLCYQLNLELNAPQPYTPQRRQPGIN